MLYGTLHPNGSFLGCFCLLLQLIKWLHMQHVSGEQNPFTACRNILQSAPTSCWEAPGAQQQLLLQQQQQLDSDLTALLGGLQQALPAQEGRDAQEQPEPACGPQQSMTSPEQLSTVSLLRPAHLVSPKTLQCSSCTSNPILEDCPRMQTPSRC